MNMFFLFSFSGFAAFLAIGLLAFLIWKDFAVSFGSLRHGFARRFEPLADAVRLERAARRLNHAILRFDAGDRADSGKTLIPS